MYVNEVNELANTLQTKASEERANLEFPLADLKTIE